MIFIKESLIYKIFMNDILCYIILMTLINDSFINFYLSDISKRSKTNISKRLIFIRLDLLSSDLSLRFNFEIREHCFTFHFGKRERI